MNKWFPLLVLVFFTSPLSAQNNSTVQNTDIFELKNILDYMVVESIENKRSIVEIQQKYGEPDQIKKVNNTIEAYHYNKKGVNLFYFSEKGYFDAVSVFPISDGNAILYQGALPGPFKSLDINDVIDYYGQPETKIDSANGIQYFFLKKNNFLLLSNESGNITSIYFTSSFQWVD